MQIKVNIDYTDDGEEDAVFQGFTIEADIKPEIVPAMRDIAVDAFFEGVKACIGWGTYPGKQ